MVQYRFKAHKMVSRNGRWNMLLSNPVIYYDAQKCYISPFKYLLYWACKFLHIVTFLCIRNKYEHNTFLQKCLIYPK